MLSLISKRICFACFRTRPLLRFGTAQNGRALTRDRIIGETHRSSVCLAITRSYSSEKEGDAETSRSALLSHKFKTFKDEDATEVLDATEVQVRRNQAYERERPDEGEHFTLYEHRDKPDNMDGLNLQRGINGVFEIEDLVDILRREKAEDICVLSVPSSMCYTDYLVVVTGKSRRHVLALAEFIMKVNKKKKSEDDPFLILEGKENPDWMVLDMGNIVLHLFLRDTRDHYDIEMLWTVGPKYDEKSARVTDDLLSQVEKYSYVADMQPTTSAGQKPHWA